MVGGVRGVESAPTSASASALAREEPKEEERERDELGVVEALLGGESGADVIGLDAMLREATPIESEFPSKPEPETEPVPATESKTDGESETTKHVELLDEKDDCAEEHSDSNSNSSFTRSATLFWY